MMKTIKPFIIALLLTAVSTAQEYRVEDILLNYENSPQEYENVLEQIANLKKPFEIVTQDGILIKPFDIVNGEPVYVIINDLLKPSRNFETAFYDEIPEKFDLSNSRVTNYDGSVTNRNLFTRKIFSKSAADSVLFLLVPDALNDRVMQLNANTGAVIEETYIPQSSLYTKTSYEILLNYDENFLLADQSYGKVFEFDRAGNFSGVFAPAGDNSNDLCRQVRGISLGPLNMIFTTIMNSSLDMALGAFDSDGSFLSAYIPAGAGGIVNSADVLSRENDILVTASNTRKLLKFDIKGYFLTDFIGLIESPMQICDMSDNEIGVASFSLETGTSGIEIYSENTLHSRSLTTINGVKGLYQLPDNSLLATNFSGLFRLNSTTGEILDTLYVGGNLKYISLIDLSKNSPPSSFSLQSPISGDTISLTEEPYVFSWERSSDPESDPVRYAVYFETSAHDTLIYTSDTVLSIKPARVFLPEETYKWYIEASDGAASTISNIVHFHTGDILTDITDDMVEPEKIALYQNFPNPFNPVTNIRFELAVGSDVDINIYDSKGELVDELYHGRLAAGNHILEWNANGYSSGIYYCILTAGNFKESIKLLLIK